MVPVGKMRQYMIFITGLARQPKQEKRVLLNASRVTNPGNSYTDSKGNDVDFPGFKISIPSTSGSKISYVNIKSSWIRSSDPPARSILWNMIAYNLNGLAEQWFDKFPGLAYKGSSQGTAKQGELGWETTRVKFSPIFKAHDNNYHVTMNASTFQQMVFELTGKHSSVSKLSHDDFDDQRLMEYKGKQLTVEQQRRSRAKSPSPALAAATSGADEESEFEDLTGGAQKVPGEIPETPPQKRAAPEPLGGEGVFTMSKEEERKKFMRAKDEKKQDSMLVYGALACVGLAGVVYYG